MTKENLVNICNKSLEDKGLSSDPRYKKRLKWEVEEILARQKWDYFWNLYEKRIRYPQNQNNLLVCWLLGIVPDFDIEKEPKCEYGEYPDIDVDYLPLVRDHIKNVWAAETFGAEYVCNISNYTTFGLKSALIDMARVHGKSREEVQALTKNLDAKDDEGKALTWDAAMKLYPDLKKYCEENKDVANAAKRLLNRNRGMGVHAGGLIIANSPLHDLVPLVKRKDSPQASAWVEGLHGQDLGPMGLVKFDLLVISNLLQIARCCEMVKERHGLDGICNLPGQPDWSDVPKWRNDPKALEMANRGDLKCIFQFDSEGIRALVKAGGVDRFEDLVAYTALFRPGCLGMKMHERYVERKKGRESFSLHPLLQTVLGTSYGVMIYQEQIMRILHLVGEIPLKDCELVRKAISKKKLEGFIKYKEMFICNGMKNLGVDEKEIGNLWDQVEAFSEYGFNFSHAVAYTYISAYLLYLKAHYPHEFFASILSCETLSEKIKDYKMEAKINGVDVCRLDINKSKVHFTLEGDLIFYGLSNVKGIGEAPAKRIADNQPYKNFEDFLCRFGTDASVLKPILGLRCFTERDPVTLWKFAECYKDAFKKTEDKKKRFLIAMQKYDDEFKELLPLEVRKLSDLKGENPFDDEGWRTQYDKDDKIETEKEIQCEEFDEGAYGKFIVEQVPVEGSGIYIEREVLKFYRKAKVFKTWNRWKELKKLWQRRKRSIDRQRAIEKQSLPTLDKFDPSDWHIDKELAKELRSETVSEEKYYGFAWIHELEKSPDYRGNFTFDMLKNDLDKICAPVEMKILKVAKKQSKKNQSFSYYQITAEDVTGQQNRINVWPDDWLWWHKEFGCTEENGNLNFTPGNLLRVRLQPPSGGFNTFTLEANQVGKYRNQKRYVDKSDDPRVFVMRHEEKKLQEEEKFLSDDEALEQFSNCTME